MVAPGLSGFDWSPDAWKHINGIIEAAQDGDAAKMTDLWMANPMMKAADENPAVAPRIRRLVAENMRCWLANPTLEKSLRPPATQRLAEIQAPTLVIVGDRDSADMQRICAKLSAEVAGARKVVILGAGHIVNMERPEEFQRALVGFLQS